MLGLTTVLEEELTAKDNLARQCHKAEAEVGRGKETGSTLVTFPGQQLEAKV